MVKNGNGAASWFSKANFTSMLNVADDTFGHGSLRNFWDGSDEKLIQRVKPRTKNVPKVGNWK